MQDFSNPLAELLTLKAPGVSGSRIRKLVQASIKLSSTSQGAKDVVAELKAHAERTPITHKLGLLYVVDAVARGLQDESRGANPGATKEALDGVTEALPEIMAGCGIRRQSSDQFDKMKKLLDIWQRAETFPMSLLDSLKETYFAAPYTTTPPGSPPSNWGGLPDGFQGSKAPAPSADALLGMLQSLAKSKVEAPAAAAAPNPTGSGSSNGAGSGGGLLQTLMAQTQTGSTKPAYERGRSAEAASNRDRDRSRSPGSTRPAVPGRINIDSAPGFEPPTRKGDATRNLYRDNELLPDKIRVYSRTLYIGNIPDNMSEAEVKEVLEEVAPVQSIVYHHEKHHAFVKIFCRKDAEKLREAFEQRNREGRTVLRARWGVGFGPRDCSNYQRGVSNIPISRLTDADRRWIRTAEYGGTGGEPLEPGQVMEEPDIEIGAGASSKAMSRQQPRMPTGGVPMMGMPMPSMPNGVPPMPGMPMPAMPGMPSMPGMPPMPGMPGMPGMPMMPGMPGMPMMAPPPGMDMQQFFAQMHQQMQQMQQAQQKK